MLEKSRIIAEANFAFSLFLDFSAWEFCSYEIYGGSKVNFSWDFILNNIWITYTILKGILIKSYSEFSKQINIFTGSNPFIIEAHIRLYHQYNLTLLKKKEIFELLDNYLREHRIQTAFKLSQLNFSPHF